MTSSCRRDGQHTPGVAQRNVITRLQVSISPMTDTDSGDGLLPEGTKPLAELILKLITGMTYVIRRGVLSIFKSCPFVSVTTTYRQEAMNL